MNITIASIKLYIFSLNVFSSQTKGIYMKAKEGKINLMMENYFSIFPLS